MPLYFLVPFTASWFNTIHANGTSRSTRFTHSHTTGNAQRIIESLKSPSAATISIFHSISRRRCQYSFSHLTLDPFTDHRSYIQIAWIINKTSSPIALDSNLSSSAAWMSALCPLRPQTLSILPRLVARFPQSLHGDLTQLIPG